MKLSFSPFLLSKTRRYKGRLETEFVSCDASLCLELCSPHGHCNCPQTSRAPICLARQPFSNLVSNLPVIIVYGSYVRMLVVSRYSRSRILSACMQTRSRSPTGKYRLRCHEILRLILIYWPLPRIYINVLPRSAVEHGSLRR